jgi:hypothetical protein
MGLLIAVGQSLTDDLVFIGCSAIELLVEALSLVNGSSVGSVHLVRSTNAVGVDFELLDFGFSSMGLTIGLIELRSEVFGCDGLRCRCLFDLFLSRCLSLSFSRSLFLSLFLSLSFSLSLSLSRSFFFFLCFCVLSKN